MCRSENGDRKVKKSNLLAGNVKVILEAVEQEERSCDEGETVTELTYLGDRVSAGGGHETATTR